MTSDLNGKLCYSYSNIVTKYPAISTTTPTLEILDNNTQVQLSGSSICNGDEFIISIEPYVIGATYNFTLDTNPVTSGAVSGNQYFTVSETTWLVNDGSIIEATIDYGSGCTTVVSTTISIITLTGTVTLATGTTSYCSGADPVPITSTGSISTNYGSLQYQWQHRTTSPTTTAWADIGLNGDGINYDPPASLGDGIHHYRRKTYVSYDGAVCESITSTVTLELGSGSAPTMTVTAVNTTDSSVISPTGTSLFICPGDSVDFNAAGSSGNGFEYFLNFSSVQSPTNLSTYTLSSISDNDVFQIRNYENADGTGCFNDEFFTLRINGWTGNNQINITTINVCDGGIQIQF